MHVDHQPRISGHAEAGRGMGLPFSATWGAADMYGDDMIYTYLCCMCGIFTYIWMIFRANVGKYTRHGASGYWSVKPRLQCQIG